MRSPIEQLPTTVSAAELRRLATQCAARAGDERDSKERARLLKIRQALLTLAENEDWLNGKADDS